MEYNAEEGFELHDDFLTKHEIIEKRNRLKDPDPHENVAENKPQEGNQVSKSNLIPSSDQRKKTQHSIQNQRKNIASPKHQNQPPTPQRKPPTSNQRKPSTPIQRKPDITPMDIQEQPPESEEATSRPTRSRNAPKRYGFNGTGSKAYFSYIDLVSDTLHSYDTLSPQAYANMLHTDPSTGVIDKCEPGPCFQALKASSTIDPDTPNFKAAMEGPHREEFLKAMDKELRQLVHMKTWETQGTICKSLPKEQKIIPLAWIFKIKRRPNGEFYKFKARLCYRGDLDLTPLPSYSPVVKWTTIRAVLAFALNKNISTKQTDFSNAFFQAYLPSDMSKYTKVPNARGFSMKSNAHLCLKLLKSLYGMLETPSLWFEALSKNIT